jgi:rhamnulokinase
MAIYIGIDLGAESGRVMLGMLEDGRITIEEVHRFPNGPVRLAGTLRWDVLRLWEEIKTGLRKVAQRGISPASVGVDSWALDYVLMRGSEPMLRAPFCYRDARTAGPYERATARERIYAETGVQFMPLNTLYHLLADAETDGALLRSADRFLMIGDWFHFLLSGRAAQEESNASTTQLWNPRTRAWSAELIREFALPPHIFPEVVPPCSRLGTLTAAVQNETGLGCIEVVAGCVHDTGAAVAAVPAEGDGWAYLSSGTWSLIGVELPAPLITDAAREANFTNETGVGGTSRFLRNASGLWILQECRRQWAREGCEWDYDALTKLAGEVARFRSVVNPNDPRFLRPGEMPAAVREACRETGQPEPETPGQFARCVFESLALLYRQMLDLVERVTAQRITTLHIVGGGSKNDLLNQMAADSTGRTVVAGPVEATVIGNLLLQAHTLGHIGSHAELRRIARDSFPVRTFLPRADAGWERARERLTEER